MKHKAYSLLNVKEVQERTEDFVIKGIASTPSPDRVNDIMEPLGARFKTPMPLLWFHKSDKPVGHVTFARPTKEGIPFEASIPNIKEPGTLKDRLDEAVQSIKHRLVAAVSIGFSEVEGKYERLKNGGTRFLEWDWRELSLVTIPANADASITSIKSYDVAEVVVPGEVARAVIDLKQFPPGASGKPLVIPRRKYMKTSVKEMIANLEATRAAKTAELQEIAKETTEKGETMDAQAGETFDTLNQEINSIDKDLKRYRVLEELNKSAAQPVVENRTDTQVVPAMTGLRVKSNLEPGVRFARWAQACIRGNFQPMNVLAAIQSDPEWMRSTPELAIRAKTAIPAADTTTAGWASEWAYAQNIESEFVEFLRPMTLIGRIPGFARVPFNIRVGGMSSGLTGYWVGQGLPIPVSKGVSTSLTLGITKAAGIASITKELARLSTPSAELMIRDEIARAIQQLLDDTFINPNNGGIANEKPASILYGVTPVTPSAATYAGLRTDLQTMMETAFDANLGTAGSVWIMSMSTALKLSMMVNALDQRVNPDLTPNGGTFQGYPVVVSQLAQISGSPQYNDIIVFLHPREIWLADDGQVAVESSDQVSLQLLDNPTNQSTSGTVATAMVSMFQTESIAIKGVRYINWGKRRSTAAQWIQAAAYV